MGGYSRRVAWASMAALLSLTSCQAGSSRTARSVDSGPPRYEVSCPTQGDCNASVALLVGLSAPSEPTRCTAALIGARTAVTAGHCVTRQLSTGGACDGLWLGFAQTDGRPSEWIGCERILSVSTPGATLLSPDYAILELAKDTTRPSLPLGDRDVAFGEVVQMVSVTADRFYDDVHQVRSRRCVVDDNGQFSPWSATASRSIRVLSSCPIRQGSSGAPVLDREGRLRGLVHAGGPPYFAFGLMTLLPQPIESDDG
jgi:hypothetical protein